MMLPVILTLVFCFGGPHCHYSRPVKFPTFAACAKAAVASVAHARHAALGDVRFTCASIGGASQ